MQPERFLTKSLMDNSWGSQVTSILSAGLRAVNPYHAVRKHFSVAGGQILVGSEQINLDQFNNIFIVGGGKAGVPMAEALIGMLGERASAGTVIVKEGYGGIDQIGRIRIREAGHPLPDERGVLATRELLGIISKAGENDLVICVLSGGGSALLTSPVPEVGLSGLAEITAALLASGASIGEINTIRKQLDMVKGGGLAQTALPARLICLILSDVVGDPLGMIASGPTVPNDNNWGQAYAILEKYHLLGHLPQGINPTWQAATQNETKGGFEKVQNILVGSNFQAIAAAAAHAEGLGLKTKVLTSRLQGEARDVGVELAGTLRRFLEKGEPISRPGVLIAGGETTVRVLGGGRGGRNQELALAAVEGLAGLENAALVTLATDGGDGNSAGAGAVVTGETLMKARNLGLDPRAYLLENDSETFFEALGDQIITGPTQTNVNDLVFLFAF